MNDCDKACLRTDAALDQRWTLMDDKLGDIQRIFLMGATQEQDDETVRLALGLVVAELYQRRARGREWGPISSE